ncbi:gibberellin cluster-kaurensynthase [Fusarium austroafricanum]|uniref:Gibberellin cluster-kaurensynthase n=1 Tax=Fusarium austroafricanum TaxID=2364996 RepID=A0A8H4JM54_9HYPO|nr:gibberellin cluster-kaurensynthase [Fusarium austroafricanum]
MLTKVTNGTVQKYLNNDDDSSLVAISLLNRAFMSYHSYYGLCTTSCQVYDTAWVSMITKVTHGVKRWLFPESFYYLLNAQLDDGSWGMLPTTQTAGILDTASALLALLTHAKDPLQIIDISKDEMDYRVAHGLSSLHRQLAGWNDIEQTNHIGIELIMPALLSSLEEISGLSSFEFPCKDILNSMHQDKLSRFDVELMYSKPSSVLHSLEAFLGKIDYDRLSHFLYHGSMMASPSSTAAYLIGSSKWDDSAESYLRHVLKEGAGHGGGGIPGTFPTTHFECSWVIATLLKAGYSRDEIDCDGLNGLADILDNALQSEDGIIGFAPQTADVDDTAKALLALSLLGRHASPDKMIKVFEGGDHFTTFGSERDPSLTSNLHVLLCLLNHTDQAKYHPQILKATLFVCQWWWETDFSLKDKWHLSHLYPTMLLVEAFIDVLRFIDSGELVDLLDQTSTTKIGLSIVQAVLRIIAGQDDDGSWGGYREQTCYAILALTQARRVCFLAQIQAKLQSCIDRAISWLRSSNPQAQDPTWTSKTAYQVAYVAEAYTLAALRSARPQKTPGTIGHTLSFGISSEDLERYILLVRKTAMFSLVDEWLLRASMIESSFFGSLLHARRDEIYLRDDSKIEEDKYLSIIPFTWVGCNNISRIFASNSWLYDMMLLSLLGYQTDEYMEAIVGPVFSDISQLHLTIDRCVDRVLSGSVMARDESRDRTSDRSIVEISEVHKFNGYSDLSSSLKDIENVLTRFTSAVLGHQAVLRSSYWDRETLSQEFRTFMHAHATQLQDNARFSQQDNSDVFCSPDQSYFQWVNTIGGSHVACAYSLAFSNCLISANLYRGKEVFPTVSQKYLISSTMRHATNMCRMYNDFGSIERDNAEQNVNSIHFPEFSLDGKDDKKKRLAGIAEYEHQCLNLALGALEKKCREETGRLLGVAESRKFSIVRLFCDVSDLYNQLYVVKDLSSQLK